MYIEYYGLLSFSIKDKINIRVFVAACLFVREMSNKSWVHDTIPVLDI